MTSSACSAAVSPPGSGSSSSCRSSTSTAGYPRACGRRTGCLPVTPWTMRNWSRSPACGASTSTGSRSARRTTTGRTARIRTRRRIAWKWRNGVFGSVVSTVTGALDRRFLRNSFVLSLAFITLCGVVALAGLGRLGAAVTAWQSWSGPTQLLAFAGFIAAVWVAGAIVQSQIRTITQLYEGYWSGLLRPLRSYGEARHRWRLTEIQGQRRVADNYAQ